MIQKSLFIIPKRRLQSKNEQFLYTTRKDNSIKLRPFASFDQNGHEEELVFDIESEDDFDRYVLHADRPVIVSFYADWCGPCQNLAPRLVAKVKGQQGKILLAKVNVDDGASLLTEQYGVHCLPTIVCIRDGEIEHRFEGDVDDGYLDQVMSYLMLKDEKLSKSSSGRVVPNQEENDNIY